MGARNRKDAELAATLNNLGAVDWNEHRTGNAREEYAEALQIYRELVQRKRETYLAAFAVALNNLGLLDRDQHRIQEARDELAEALQIRRELAQKNLGNLST